MPKADDLRQTQTQTVQSPLGKSVTSAPTCDENLFLIMNELNTAPSTIVKTTCMQIHVN